MKAAHILTIESAEGTVRIEATTAEALASITSKLLPDQTDADDPCDGEIWIELEA
jgi:hypothetical protein